MYSGQYEIKIYMNISKIKKTIIAYLFGFAVLLLAANVIAAKVFKNKGVKPESGMDTGSINKGFLEDLNNFGL